LVAGLGVLSLSFWITLTLIDSTDQEGGADIGPAQVPLIDDDGMPRTSRPSSLRDLPPAPSGFLFRVAWDGIDGLNAKIIGPAPIAGGSLVLSLVATQTAGLHRLGLQFAGVPTNRLIQTTAWVKAPAGTRINVDVRDGKSRGGESQNSGSVAFDLAPRAILSSSGNVRAFIEQGPGEWLKLQVQMQSADGVVVLYLGLLGPSPIPSGAGQQMIFGGIELAAV
jgi:hypothetical protein